MKSINLNIPTTSTPKLDRELAENKIDKHKNYIIKPDGPMLYLMSPDEKETYINIDRSFNNSILMGLGKDKVLYIYQIGSIVWNSQRKKVKNINYVDGVKFIDGKGNTIKDLNIYGYFTFPSVSEDGSFIIFQEDIDKSLDLSNPEAIPDLIVNPAHFSTRRGILAFDGNGNELWEDELNKDEVIDDVYTKISRTGKYTFIRTEKGGKTKSYIYSRNGEKTPVDMYAGYFSRNEQYFIYNCDYIYDLKTNDKIYLGIGIASERECVDVSDREAGVAIATYEGYLYIIDIKSHLRIAKIDVNTDYLKKYSKANSENKNYPKDNGIRELYISSDGTEILIKTPINEYRYRRVEK